ncbi:MAG: threonine synthase [Thermoplasmatota archaeon]
MTAPRFLLVCRHCHAAFPPALTAHCEKCLGPLEVRYELDALRESVTRERLSRGPPSIWRWAPLLPVEDPDNAVDLGAGGRPLKRAKNLGARLGLRELWILDDSVNPTYSFKDRATSVAATKAREAGLTTLACASTGNLAASVAAHAASAGLASVVLVPENVEPEKLVQTAAYGARIVRVKGAYDAANQLAQVAGEERGWGVVNVNLRAFYTEGSCTLAYDTARSLGWETPDHVVHPIAAGASLAALGRGFDLLRDLDLVDGPRPRISGAQPAGVSPVVRALDAGEPVRPWERIDTLAHSLAIARPADGDEAVDRIRASGGSAAAVTDDEIVAGIRLLASTEGIFTEPAGGTTVAALVRLVERGVVRSDERVVLNITGNGLKAPSAVPFALPGPIPGRLSALDAALGLAEVTA